MQYMQYIFYRKMVYNYLTGLYSKQTVHNKSIKHFSLCAVLYT